jgi:hypothetical protein
VRNSFHPLISKTASHVFKSLRFRRQPGEVPQQRLVAVVDILKAYGHNVAFSKMPFLLLPLAMPLKRGRNDDH